MQHKNINMIVSDLDGTLLSPEREISQEAVETIAELKKLGVIFTFITGRPPYAVKRFAQRIGIDGPIAGCNGAVIFKGEQLIAKHSFKLKPVKSLMEDAALVGMTVLVYSDGTEYCLRETDWSRIRSMPVLKRGIDELLAVEKVNIMTEEADKFQRLLPRITALKEQLSVAVYGHTGCEIVAKEANKATGLDELCRLCNVSKEHVLAIGDNENDNSMLKAAGIGAAVANAAKSTKQAADYVCRTSYTDGVIEAIRKFVLEA